MVFAIAVTGVSVGLFVLKRILQVNSHFSIKKSKAIVVINGTANQLSKLINQRQQNDK
jgi:hypothetical protein